jgi:hypothetical protein
MFTKDLFKRLKVKFDGSENIKQNYSQALQDMFVLTMLNGKKNGVYIDVGSYEPCYLNNTYLLEKDFEWTGTAFDIDSGMVAAYNQKRVNKCIEADATKFDYKTLFKALKYPKQIDYISLDVEPSTNTLKALYQLPHEDYRFSVLTFEHDLYRFGVEVQQASREFLKKLNYKLVVSDVTHNGNCFEDWYIDPSVIVKNAIENKSHNNITELFFA